MRIFLLLAFLSAPAQAQTQEQVFISNGYRFHYPKGLFSDAEKVAGFVYRAEKAMLQEFSRFQPNDLLQSISLDVYLHGQSDPKVSVGDMYIDGAYPCGNRVCQKYAYSIHLLTPSLWPHNSRYDETYFLRNIIHEYSTMFLEIITRNKGSGWSLHQSDTPSWFVQGYEDFLGLVHSNNPGRLEDYKKELRSNPDVVSLKFNKNQKNIIAVASGYEYTAGALLLAYMHETFGRDAVQKILLSRQDSFYDALEKELSTSVDDFYEGWKRWSAAF